MVWSARAAFANLIVRNKNVYSQYTRPAFGDTWALRLLAFDDILYKPTTPAMDQYLAFVVAGVVAATAIGVVAPAPTIGRHAEAYLGLVGPNDGETMVQSVFCEFLSRRLLCSAVG